MKTNIRDNLARFFYDVAKLSVGVLVLGAITRRPFLFLDVVVGVIGAFLFIGAGVIIDSIPEKGS